MIFIRLKLRLKCLSSLLPFPFLFSRSQDIQLYIFSFNDGKRMNSAYCMLYKLLQLINSIQITEHRHYFVAIAWKKKKKHLLVIVLKITYNKYTTTRKSILRLKLISFKFMCVSAQTLIKYCLFLKLFICISSQYFH